MTHSSNFINRRNNWTCFAFCLAAAGCGNASSGTEGDNPVVGPVQASPCKGEEEYATYLARPQGALDVFGQRDFATLEQGLVTRDEVPIGLECLQRQYDDAELRLEISNFAGGCAIEWAGQVELRAPGEVAIVLSNPSCDIARCGNCAYDAHSELDAAPAHLFAEPSARDLRVTLELRDCEGVVTSSLEWELDVPDGADGITCRPVDSWSWLYNKVSGSDLFDETQKNLYAVCGEQVPEAIECTEDRVCQTGYCVPECSIDADFPLEGALTCQDGACLVPSD